MTQQGGEVRTRVQEGSADGTRALTTDQAEFVKGSLAAERQKLLGAMESLDRWNEADQEVFSKFFGEPSDIARAHVREVYGRMLAQNNSYSAQNFRFDPNESAPAYVYRDEPDTIYLGKRFFGLNTESQAAGLIHERSHFDVIAATSHFSNIGPGQLGRIRELPQTEKLGNAQSYGLFPICLGRPCN